MPHESILKSYGLRLAHSDGFTDICFAEDGSLVSGGDDGYVCIWSASESADSQDSQYQLGDAVSCLSVHKDSLYAVIANNTLSLFDFPSCSFNKICLKLSDQITHFTSNSSGSSLAVGSSDFKIRFLDCESLSVPLTLSEHQAPVLSVAFSPGSSELLASSSCDSTVRLWSTNEGKSVSTFGRVIPKSNDVANSPTLCRLQFSPDGKLLYVPTEGEIKVYDVRNWHKPCDKIDLPKKAQVSSYVRFSPGGEHFAAICKDTLEIFSLVKSNWIAKLNHSKPLCALAWNPSAGNRIAFTDTRGQLGFVSAPMIEATVAKTSATAVEIDTVEDDDAALMLVAAELGDDTNDNMDAMAKLDDSIDKAISVDNVKNLELFEDESIQVVKSKSKARESSKATSSKKFDFADDNSNLASEVAGIGDVDDDGDDITDLGRIRNEFKEFFDDDEDDDDDDEPSEKRVKATTVGGTSTPTDKGATAPVSNNLLGEPLASRPVLSQPADSHLQQAFQIGSTTSSIGGQGSRFLAWNQLGVVRMYEPEADNGESSIEAEFHDASVHPPISLSSSDEFVVAALSADVLVLASLSSSYYEEEDEKSRTCRIRVLTLSSWDSSREWICELPSDERCVSVAIGSKWIAVVTNKQFIRLFSLSGFQLGILSVSGPPVTAVGKGDSLAVVYHSGIGAFHCQSLSFDLYKMASRSPKLMTSGNLPISPGSTLTWAGFGADFCTLFTSDSKAILRAHSLASKSWTPVANIRRCGQIKSRSDHYWVVGVSEKQQQIFAIFCKASTYPAVLPRPILSTVPLGVPVCDARTDAGKLADEAIRLRLFAGPQGSSSSEDADMKLQESLMRLFAIALKQERQCRAAEIAETMPSSHAIQLASKYAARLRLGHLADVLNQMAMNLDAEQSQQTADDFLLPSYHTSDHYTSVSTHQPAPEPLPVLATPPIVTLIKRPLGGSLHTPASQLASGVSSDMSRAATTSLEDDKKRENNEAHIQEDVLTSDNDGDDYGEDEAEIVSEKTTAPATTEMPKPHGRPNPFKSRASTGIDVPTKRSGSDAFACFERVEPIRSKPSVADSSRKKKSARKSGPGDDDGVTAAKKKRPTKRKNESALAVGNEGDDGSSKGSNVENEDSLSRGDSETPSNQALFDGGSVSEKKTKGKGSTAPTASTMRKLTDFMFSKN